MSRWFKLFAVAAVLLVSSLALAQTQPVGTSPATGASKSEQPEESLAETARRIRKEKPIEVRTTPQDTKELFAAVDEVMNFASEESGLPKKTTVKRQMISMDDAARYFRERLARADLVERFSRSELTMKKFGLLPRDFNLRDFLVKATPKQVLGFYDHETKMISMLNWVPADKQKLVLSHELTHALQDQNYDLGTWGASSKQNAKPAGASAASAWEDGEGPSARQAVVEGQAMVVMLDYMLAPFGRNLKNTPELTAVMEDPQVTTVIDTEFTHNAPMVLREAGAFPYREGLFFEAEVLQHAGKEMAFAGVFQRPPRSTHEVLEPRSYLEGEKLDPISMPDVRPLVSDRYEMYDGGGFGALDVRALLRQLGFKRQSEDLCPAWRGGSYLAFKRKGSSAEVSTAGVALLYVSRWSTPQMARKFAQVYEDGVAKRYAELTYASMKDCGGDNCPITRKQISTEEGPVIIEQWADNMVVISENFDSETEVRLREAVLHPSGSGATSAQMQDELSLRLYEIPAFRAYQDFIGETLLQRAVELSAR